MSDQPPSNASVAEESDSNLERFPVSRQFTDKPSKEQAEAAVRTLLLWAGEDPNREGLQETPERVVRAWGELFSGYSQDYRPLLERTFSEISGYDQPVTLTDIDFQSHCEHHLLPIIGRIHVSYLPAGRIVGLSKIVRLCEIFTRRMQTQENLTAQIAEALYNGLDAKGVAVRAEARHYCMISRGIRNPNSTTVTNCFLGIYRDDEMLRREFFLQTGNGLAES